MNVQHYSTWNNRGVWRAGVKCDSNVEQLVLLSSARQCCAGQAARHMQMYVIFCVFFILLQIIGSDHDKEEAIGKVRVRVNDSEVYKFIKMYMY